MLWVMSYSPPKLLAAGAMARRLRVPVGWLRDEAAAGRIPHLKADRQLLFNPEAVEDVLLKRAGQAEPQLGPSIVPS